MQELCKYSELLRVQECSSSVIARKQHFTKYTLLTLTSFLPLSARWFLTR